MAGDYRAYLAFKALRRRVEQRLSGGALLTAHAMLFVAFAVLFMIVRNLLPPVQLAAIGNITAVWSMVLLAHGLYASWHTGSLAGASRHTAVIEDEIARQLASDDPSNTLIDGFQLHTQLEQGVLMRGKALLPIVFLTMFNAMIWGIAGFAARYDANFTLPWQLTPIIALPFVAWWMYADWRRQRFDQRQFEAMQAGEDALDAKPKRELDAALRLSDDGELVAFEDDAPLQRKRMEG